MDRREDRKPWRRKKNKKVQYFKKNVIDDSSSPSEHEDSSSSFDIKPCGKYSNLRKEIQVKQSTTSTVKDDDDNDDDDNDDDDDFDKEHRHRRLGIVDRMKDTATGVPLSHGGKGTIKHQLGEKAQEFMHTLLEEGEQFGQNMGNRAQNIGQNIGNKAHDLTNKAQDFVEKRIVKKAKNKEDAEDRTKRVLLSKLSTMSYGLSYEMSDELLGIEEANRKFLKHESSISDIFLEADAEDQKKNWSFLDDDADIKNNNERNDKKGRDHDESSCSDYYLSDDDDNRAATYNDSIEQEKQNAEETRFENAKRYYNQKKMLSITKIANRNSYEFGSGFSRESATELFKAFEDVSLQDVLALEEEMRNISTISKTGKDDDDEEEYVAGKSKHTHDGSFTDPKNKLTRSLVAIRTGPSNPEMTFDVLVDDAIKSRQERKKLKQQIQEKNTNPTESRWNSVVGSANDRTQNHKKRLQRRYRRQHPLLDYNRTKFFINASIRNIVTADLESRGGFIKEASSLAEWIDSPESSSPPPPGAAAADSSPKDNNNKTNDNLSSPKQQQQQQQNNTIEQLSLTIDTLDQLLSEQEDEISQLEVRSIENTQERQLGGMYHKMITEVERINSRISQLKPIYIDTKYDVVQALAYEDHVKFVMDDTFTTLEGEKDNLKQKILSSMTDIQSLEREIRRLERPNERRLSQYMGISTSLINSRWSFSEDLV